MKRRIAAGLAATSAAAMLLTACSGGSEADNSGGSSGPTTLTLAGWSLSTTPEFQLLADTFHESHPDITVELVEYSAEDYDTQMIADLAAGSAPDLYVLKNLKNFVTYQDGDQLLDVSDVAGQLGEEVSGVDAYTVDGKTYAIPYRQDAWYLYYNKDLFDQAGVDYPDGSWTWHDYAEAAKQLTSGLEEAGSEALGTYQHSWQSTVQGFATAQSPDAKLLSGNWDYMIPFYERAMELQRSGAQLKFGTITTNSITYQSQFGTQKAAMMPMGSWYVATLLAQVKEGTADDFNWGIAPAPQVKGSDADKPVTFADPTGIGINPAIDEDEVDAAKEFLKFIAGEEAATALAGIGITPALTNDAVTEAYFAGEGMPTDELSKYTFSTHIVRPENPVDPRTAALQNILKAAHSAILTGSVSPAEGIAQAEQRAAEEVLG